MRLLVCPIIPISPRSFSPVPSVPGPHQIVWCAKSRVHGQAREVFTDLAGSQAVEEIAFFLSSGRRCWIHQASSGTEWHAVMLLVGFSNRHPKTRTGSKRDVPGEDLTCLVKVSSATLATTLSGPAWLSMAQGWIMWALKSASSLSSMLPESCLPDHVHPPEKRKKTASRIDTCWLPSNLRVMDSWEPWNHYVGG